jgi:hypothetical protein
MTVSTDRTKTRVYVTGDTYPIKDRLKQAGCHWDSERSQWWIGVAKAGLIQQLVKEANAPSQDSTPTPTSANRPKEDLDGARVHAKVEYKGRTYYQVAETKDGSRLRLVTLDGKVDFWADRSACKTIRTYPPREVRQGYSRYYRTEYTTIGSIRRFVEQQKDPATRRGECTECGAWGPSGEPCSECGGEGSYV